MKKLYEQLLKQAYLYRVQRKIIETDDGSKTIHIEEWNENYHSTHGAVQEAEHVFMDKVRERIGNRTEISILEMGFGTGLNAFLTLRLAMELNVKVNYLGLEAFPVKKEELDALNYTSFWEEGKQFYESIHAGKWGEIFGVAPNFNLTKLETKFEDWSPQSGVFDFIFFDAFGPRVQPELWTIPIFEKLFLSAKEGAFFLTYCAKGQVRRDLESVGFAMSRLPGPPGKREMLLGEK
jgi:tRNA U34 5-methylaminomethyl-2-thiouridine-forming methyltransferase MnmC